jgi:L-malate glycosyltransferase
MRIVYLGFNGGIHMQRWAAFFAQQGHDVHVVTCGGDNGRAPYAVHDLGPLRLGKLGYFLKVRAARRTVRRLRPHLVHAHYATSYGLLGLATSFRPFVVTAHGDDLLIAPRNPLLRWVVSRVLGHADLVTVPSEQMRVAAHGLAGRRLGRIEVLQYGVELDRLASLGDELRSPSDTGRIVSARPLLGLYRIDQLVRAVAVLAGRGRQIELTIAGDGPERRSLERLSAEQGVGDLVRFVGQIPPEEVEQRLAEADVTVSISSSDGASVALLEAMAIGAVPVVSDISANTAWIDDRVGGIVVRVGAREVADGIEQALALDPAAVRAHNREVIRRRGDRDTNLGRLDRMLRELVAA